MKIAKASHARRGFTFTISMLLLCLTLIAMAAFAQEWRMSQQSSFTRMLPAEAYRLQERIAADAGEMLGAKASLKKTSQNTAAAGVSVQLPFKKEGEPLARMNDYSSSLAYSLRNLGFEAVLSANNISGSNATVMTISGTGRLDFGNNGGSDVATLYHPLGWVPTGINVTMVCDKAARGIGPLSMQELSAYAGPAYYVNYSEKSGRNYLANNTTAKQGTAAFAINYDDGSVLSVASYVLSSASRNYTSISYTKSPRGYLILPFEQNATVSPGDVRDYSPHAHNLTLGGGNGNAAPAWLASCKFRGCYSFDGSNDYMAGPTLNLTESAAEFAPGADRIDDGDLESGSFNPDNGISDDDWDYWKIKKKAGVLFDSTKTSHSGDIAVKIGAGSEKNYFYQKLDILENVPYTLSFWTRSENGAGSGRYTITDKTAGNYLQEDGSWGGEYYFDSGVTAAEYQQVSRQFALPVGSTSLQIELVASELGTVYFDTVSLRQTAGLNGGFEYYYPDTTDD